MKKTAEPSVKRLVKKSHEFNHQHIATDVKSFALPGPPDRAPEIADDKNKGDKPMVDKGRKHYHT